MKNSGGSAEKGKLATIVPIRLSLPRWSIRFTRLSDGKLQRRLLHCTVRGDMVRERVQT